MSVRIFHESGIQFSFSEDWQVLKYDDHRFYKYLSGSGLKGVDFIILQNGRLLLIEVKNYADRMPLDKYVPIDALLRHPEIYAQEYIQKFEDTIRLLDIVSQYYQRKWWYRKIFPWLKSWYPEKSLLKREVGFWSRAIELANTPEYIDLILWLELPLDMKQPARSELIDYLKNVIPNNFTEPFSFSIVDSKHPIPGIESTYLTDA